MIQDLTIYILILFAPLHGHWCSPPDIKRTLNKHWFSIWIIIMVDIEISMQNKCWITQSHWFRVDWETTVVEKPSTYSWPGNMVENASIYSWPGNMIEIASIYSWPGNMIKNPLIFGWPGDHRVVDQRTSPDTSPFWTLDPYDQVNLLM